MKTLVLTLIMLASTQAFGFEKEDSFASLRSAMLESNKDYNDHKKAMLDEENDRISDWGKRSITAVTIEASIEEEARDYKVSVND